MSGRIGSQEVTERGEALLQLNSQPSSYNEASGLITSAALRHWSLIATKKHVLGTFSVLSLPVYKKPNTV